MVHLALQKRGLAGLGALLLANLQAFGERPLPRNFGLDPVRLLLAETGRFRYQLRMGAGPSGKGIPDQVEGAKAQIARPGRLCTRAHTNTHTNRRRAGESPENGRVFISGGDSYTPQRSLEVEADLIERFTESNSAESPAG